MSNELAEIRLSTKPPIPAKAMTAVVRQRYPRFDNTLLSKCEHGEEYGIELKRDALEDLRRNFCFEAVATPEDDANEYRTGKCTTDRHRLKKRVHCRLTDSEYWAFKRNIEKDGYATAQEWIAEAVRNYNRKKREGKERDNA